MIRFAWRNLFQNKVRLVISTGGVALALMLILALDAIVAGIETQSSAYIDHSGADVFVAQPGVRNMHMASSSLPAAIVERVRGVAGVSTATPILYLTNVVAVGDERVVSYVIGLPPGAAAGGPWRVAAGARIPAPGEAIVDRDVARRAGAAIGDRVSILGQTFTIAGLSEGTASLAGSSSVAFVSFADFARLRGDSDTVSFVLVNVAPGVAPEDVAARIEAQTGGVTALTRDAFAAQERQVVRDMSTDIVNIMNLVGVLIGLAVMALTVYTATLARRAEYGVLKALGARNGRLYLAVLAQAAYSVALGLAFGLAFTLALSALTPWLGINLELDVRGAAVLKAAGVAWLIAACAAVLPVRQIAGLDPAQVFRGKAR
jgi:putative ABC transport system permease protein